MTPTGEQAGDPGVERSFEHRRDEPSHPLCAAAREHAVVQREDGEKRDVDEHWARAAGPAGRDTRPKVTIGVEEQEKRRDEQQRAEPREDQSSGALAGHEVRTIIGMYGRCRRERGSPSPVSAWSHRMASAARRSGSTSAAAAARRAPSPTSIRSDFACTVAAPVPRVSIDDAVVITERDRAEPERARRPDPRRYSKASLIAVIAATRSVG